MRARVAQRQRTYEVCSGLDEPASGAQRVEVSDVEAVAALVRRLLREDPRLVRRLRSFVDEKRAVDLPRRLASRIVRGQLRLYRVDATTVAAQTDGWQGQVSGAPEEQAPEPDPVLRSSQPADYIEVALYGEDGELLAGERYLLELPDGGVKRGRTRKDAPIRIEGIAAGTCDVTFPDLDKNAWEAM